MAVNDKNVSKAAKIAEKELVVSIVTAVSQSDVVAFSYVPGFPFEIVSVKNYARTEAGAVTADVKIGSTSALASAVAFATATATTASLSSTLASRRGSSTDAINVHYTSDGTGALTNGHVVVVFRPMPLNGDAATE